MMDDPLLTAAYDGKTGSVGANMPDENPSPDWKFPPLPSCFIVALGPPVGFTVASPVMF